MANEVATQNEKYKDALPTWTRCRIAAAGQQAVHAAGKLLLSPLGAQSDQEYEAYKKRSLYFNATGRTVDGLSGLVFRKPPVVTSPASLDYLKQDADTAGTPLQTMCEEVVQELLVVGRIGLLADYPVVEPGGTQADAMNAGARPNVSVYTAEQLINWRVGNVNNKVQLTLAVLAEIHEIEHDFETECIPQLRVLRLTLGIYTIEIWREIKDARGATVWAIVAPPSIPIMNGKPLDYIPFVVCGPRGIDTDPSKPPIEDLVDVNLSHYTTTADYEHGLHFTGLPTPIVTGHTFGDQEVFELGATKVKGFGNPDAKAFFLEFTGEGLTSLSKRLTEKEAMMATLGARLLAAEKRGIESAETAMIHRSGENGVLASLAMAASAALSIAFTWAAGFAGSQEAFTIQLNTDYLPAGMTSAEMSELIKSWQSGAISYLTLYDNLQRGEIARQGVSAEEELAQIQIDWPSDLSTEPGA